MFRKFLFIMILFGALLFGGVAHAEGVCFCTKTNLNDQTDVIFDQPTKWPDKVGMSEEKCIDETVNKIADKEGIVAVYSGCHWEDNVEPESSSSQPKSQSGGTAPAGAGGISTAPVDATVVKLENPLGVGRTDIRVILGDIIKYAMGILGSLTLLVFVFGGFLWLTSAGSDERVKKGSQTMLWAVIGIFIIFASYGILTLVFKAIGAK